MKRSHNGPHVLRIDLCECQGHFQAFGNSPAVNNLLKYQHPLVWVLAQGLRLYGVFEEMRRYRIGTDSIACNTLASACERGDAWHVALELLSRSGDWNDAVSRYLLFETVSVAGASCVGSSASSRAGRRTPTLIPAPVRVAPGTRNVVAKRNGSQKYSFLLGGK